MANNGERYAERINWLVNAEIAAENKEAAKCPKREKVYQLLKDWQEKEKAGV